MSGITGEEYLELIARFIVQMESQFDCIGATAFHLQELGKNSHLERDEAVHVHAFWKGLVKAGERMEVEQAFIELISAGYTPEEVEDLTNGGDEEQ